MSTSKLIKVKEKIADNLATRNSADKLFNYVKSQKQETIILDFESVKFATRSFMHEYLLKKLATNKRIMEKNMSKEVKKMLVLVAEPNEKKSTVTNYTFKSLLMSSKTR